MAGVRRVRTDAASRPARLVARLGLRAPAPARDEAGHRHASWLELFFDVIFVFALAAVVNRLGTGPVPPPRDVLIVCGLFVVVQWAWVGQVFYDTRYDPDDIPHRLMVLVALAGAGAVTLGVGETPDSVLLPIGYLIIRGVLLLLYLRVRPAGGAAREVTDVYLTGFGLGWLIWLGSLAVPAATRPVLWTVAMCVELATPWLGLRRLRRSPVDIRHLPERLGQFSIIVLGSTVANLLGAVPNRPEPRTILAAAVAFVVPASVWWIYTTFVTTGLAVNRLRGGQAYTYLQGPMSAALLLLGWSLGEVVRLTVHGAETVPPALRLMLGASIVIWMLGGLGLNLLAVGRPDARRLVISGYGVGSISLIALAASRPLPLLVLVSVALTLYAALVTRRLTAQRAGAARQPAAE
ncbi:MAG TPA: low temperature requirement protein A [Micromonosporaceae bacterium]